MGEVITIRLDSGLFNGLANAGDRLVLLTREGAVVDSLSWGDDTSRYGPPLVAPGAGELLRRRFAQNGALVAVVVAADDAAPVDGATEDDSTVAAAATPTEAAPTASPPALAVEVVTRTPTPSDAGAATATATEPALDERTAGDGGSGVNRAAWIALASIALGALSGVGAFRLRELLSA